LESADSICVTQANRKWRAVVKALKNLGVAQKLGKFFDQLRNYELHKVKSTWFS
jgi:nitrate reductase assembly molybdenum cofactor insertion protein NarJ